MNDNRLINAKRNISSAIIKQSLGVILPFIIRTIVIYVLGASYQGISGLFTSVLQVLNLTDMGFSSAVMYVLYKPIAEENYRLVCSIIAFLKKIYRYVGGLLLLFGLLIMPFINKIISGEVPKDINIYILFGIYIFNSAISYLLFAYKSVLLTAMQKENIVSNIYTITTTGIRVVQIALLLAFKNYYIFICVLPLATILNNFLIQYYSKKLFPNITAEGQIPSDVKGEVIRQVKAIFINKIGDIARNAFDNIIISLLFGLTIVTVYDNYYYIYSALYSFLFIVSQAMQASIGNSIAVESIEKNNNDINRFTYIYMMIAGWCTVCMFCLYQMFVTIWMNDNKEMLLPDLDMILCCICFYSLCLNNIRNLYINGNGLFWECRYWYIIEAIANLLLNIVLGKLLGITGIILATLTTVILFNYIARTNILFKLYFKKSAKSFYLDNIYYFIVTVIVAIITRTIIMQLPFKGIIGLFFDSILCGIIAAFLYIVFYFNTERFKDAWDFIKRAFKLKREDVN